MKILEGNSVWSCAISQQEWAQNAKLWNVITFNGE